MLRAVLDASHYAYVYSAGPPLIVGTAVVVLALAVMRRERGSAISLAYAGLSASVGLWLWSFAGIYCTYDPNIARFWSHLEAAAVAFIPSFLLYFSLLVLKRLPKYRVWSNISLSLSGLFCVLALIHPSYVTDVWRYPWGFYPLYGPASWPFLALMAAAYAASMTLIWKAYQPLPPGNRRAMLRSLFIAFAVGGLGMIDFLASYRIVVYPIGYLPVYTSLLMLAQAVWRYNFSDITPSVAATQILETLPSAIIVTDADGIITLVNPKATEIFGAEVEQLIGSEPVDLFPGLLTPEHRQALKTAPVLPDFEMALRSTHSETQFLIVSISATRDANGRIIGYICAIRNVTAFRRAETALRDSEARFHRLVAANIIGFMRVSLDGTVLEANDALLRMMGYTREDLEAGRLRGAAITPPEHQTLDIWMAERLHKTGLCPPVEKEYIRQDGSRLAVLVGVLRLSPEEGDLCFVIDATDRRQAMDALRKAYDEMEYRVSERTAELSHANEELAREIEQRKRAEAALHSLSITDPLTGLYNRRGFLTLAEQLLKQAQRAGNTYSIFMLDLDGLKEINDTYGHLEGDQALNRVATILKDVFRASDVVSRLGGDEFAIAVLEDSPDSGEAPLRQRLTQRLAEWNARHDKAYLLQFSVGVGRRESAESISVESLLQRADLQLYEHKRRHKRSAV